MKACQAAIAAVLLSISSAHADWVIVQTTKSDGQETRFTIRVKGDLIRNDMGASMSMVVDAAGGANMISHPTRSYIHLDAKGLSAAADAAAKSIGADSSKPLAKPKATGEMVKVGDWNTEVFTWEDDGRVTKLYVAKDYPKFAELSAAIAKAMKPVSAVAARFPNPADLPGMVVKSETTIMGKVAVTELVSAKEEPVDDGTFAAPAAYKEIKIPGLGR